METVAPVDQHYDNRTIFFHWATLLLVTLQFAIAWTIDDFPTPALRIDARSVHITIGLLLTILLVARIAWRSTSGRRLPPADRGVLHVVAKGTHWGLYLILVAMVLVGMFLTWARGDVIYNLFKIPAFDPADHAIRHNAQELHATIGWVIIALVGLHALAAIAHRLLWRDGVLARMLPYHRLGKTNADAMGNSSFTRR